MTRSFRALLLAAGLGTRLRPITLHTPKCLVPIKGEPLLGHWLRKLEIAGCDSVLINTHYLADQVEAFLKGWQSSTMVVQTVHEPQLLGTAGTLLANQAFSGAQQDCSFMLTTPWQEIITDFMTPTISAPQLPTDHADLRNEHTEQLRNR